MAIQFTSIIRVMTRTRQRWVLSLHYLSTASSCSIQSRCGRPSEITQSNLSSSKRISSTDGSVTPSIWPPTISGSVCMWNLRCQPPMAHLSSLKLWIARLITREIAPSRKDNSAIFNGRHVRRPSCKPWLTIGRQDSIRRTKICKTMLSVSKMRVSTFKAKRDPIRMRPSR